jgi:hypothetical protein
VVGDRDYDAEALRQEVLRTFAKEQARSGPRLRNDVCPFSALQASLWFLSAGVIFTIIEGTCAWTDLSLPILVAPTPAAFDTSVKFKAPHKRTVAMIGDAMPSLARGR